MDAIASGDIVAVADGAADLKYAVNYAANCFGIDLEPIETEVQRSNMSKKGGYKREDGKWIKPDTYSPADLEPIIAKQMK